MNIFSHNFSQILLLLLSMVIKVILIIRFSIYCNMNTFRDRESDGISTSKIIGVNQYPHFSLS